MKTADKSSIAIIQTAKVCGSTCTTESDRVSVEEPLEIRLAATSDGAEVVHQVAVTMRTPGHDSELAAGFLFTEGIISCAADIAGIDDDKCNVVSVYLKEHVEVDARVFARHSFMASSCGVCGKKSIDAVRVKRQYDCVHDSPLIAPSTVHGLAAGLRAVQADFERTGGLHASCLFDSQGQMQIIREDVGRHNALDKVIGSRFLSNQLPLHGCILMVSGRASFELIQKAAHAGIAVIAAVGAPSSLAVQLAEECDMTLLGFVRDDRFNIYSGQHRVDLDRA